jgi:hypothetical protein
MRGLLDFHMCNVRAHYFAMGWLTTVKTKTCPATDALSNSVVKSLPSQRDRIESEARTSIVSTARLQA